MFKNPFLRALFCLILGLLITACGFGLRGSSDSLSLTSQSFSINAPNALRELRITFEQTLVSSGAIIRSGSENQISLVSEQVQKRALTRDHTGRPTEIELRLTIDYQFGSTEPSQYKTNRRFVYDVNQLLTAERRERELIADMREETARFILSRWSTR